MIVPASVAALVVIALATPVVKDGGLFAPAPDAATVMAGALPPVTSILPS